MGKRGKNGASLPLRLFSLLLSAILVASSFPVEALAEILPEPEETVVVEPAADESDEVVVEGEVEEPIVQEAGEDVSELVDIPEVAEPEGEGEAETTVGPEEGTECYGLDEGEASALLGASPDATDPLGGPSAAGYVWPLRSAGTITQNYSAGGHGGTDIAIAGGSDVLAAADGVVKYVQTWDGTITGNGRMMSYGNLVIIYHPDKGTATYYAHLQDYVVSQGQQVSQGTVIGHSGNTGEVYGSGGGYHLHFELRLNANPNLGTYGKNDGTRTNPLNYVGQNNLFDGNANHAPISCLDSITAGNHTITLRGWSFDPDAPSASLRIDIYIGGGAGDANADKHTFIANASRPDVNNAYGISGNHGIDVTIPTTRSGTLTVYMYALDTSGSPNPNFATRAVTIGGTLGTPSGAVQLVNGAGYSIRPILAPQMAISVKGQSTSNFAEYELRPWANVSYQAFNVRRNTSGNLYRTVVVGRQSNKVFDLNCSLSNSGWRHLIQHETNGGDNQLWYFVRTSGDQYKIMSALTGDCVDLPDFATASGTYIHLMTDNGSNAERFYLVPLDMTRATVSVASSVAYDGKAKKPKVTVTSGGVTLVEGLDYSVSYSNNTNVGTATVRVTGLGQFSGSKTATFKITGSNVTLIPIYRMYNTRTSEHLWTKSKKEYDSCGKGSYADWRQEGIAWYSPGIAAPASTSGSTQGDYVYVWRLYDRDYTGDHVYLTWGDEMRQYLDDGWVIDKGAGFWTLKKGATISGRTTIPIYRQFNGRLKRGKHHYTPSKVEYDTNNRKNGWTGEGVKFYVVKK